MHDSRILRSGLGYRDDHKPRFSITETGLYEMSNTDF